MGRRIATRGVLIFGAALLSKQLIGSYPRDQVLVFPVGSVFPNATHFGASWKRAEDREPRGGVELFFAAPPPLQIRHHATLPDGDYLVTVEIRETRQTPQLSAPREGMQTNIERRVTLLGGETMVALAAGGF